jgi:hypothetical protein
MFFEVALHDKTSIKEKSSSRKMTIIMKNWYKIGASFKKRSRNACPLGQKSAGAKPAEWKETYRQFRLPQSLWWSEDWFG